MTRRETPRMAPETQTATPTPTPPPLLAGGLEGLAGSMGDGAGEDLWIEVIRQMDSVYADLVTSQTALEEQHRELSEAHGFIGSVLDAMTDVVLACGADGRLQRVNGALTAIVGESEQALLGREVEALFAPDERGAVRDAMIEVRSGGVVDQREWNLLMADGTPATVSTNIAPRRDGAGLMCGFVFVGRPLGDLQRAYRALDKAHSTLQRTQEQLLMSEKMAALGRLVAGVAHELNNPISFVFGNMYALKRYGDAIARYLEATGEHHGDPALDRLRAELRIDRILADIGPLVDGTLEGAERVRDIVQDLRRFSSNQEETPEPFNLARLVRTAAEWVAKAQRVKPRFTFDLPDPLDLVSRKGQLHQIAVNLVQNACDALAGQADGAVLIRAWREGATCFLMVADNGPGIPAARRDKIFEPFFTTKPIGSGTGLGLYVSYNMAAKLGGALRFEDNPGGGARFVLTLPDLVGEDAA
ncbi:ATP-binding protein [Novosphingobium sp. 1949]|uniref:histidine kinase n=1 Tax=Novosphingobium organovorum TaxID=2930092 RepID=A0ABT0BCX5_9SPHN|nr:ATP-binding protein [Novosphingobium organovorum]MCJ2182814.1 ATP-binding protein [Novosphingobium organovorum]